jgi:hypothetical protein
MLPFYMPDWGFINPFVCCDARGLFPNVGNWGVQYTLQGTFTNPTSQPLVVRLHMSADGCESPFAMRSAVSAQWQNVVIEPNHPVVWMTLSVSPSQTVPFQADYVLTGPGCGGEYHWFTVDSA